MAALVSFGALSGYAGRGARSFAATPPVAGIATPPQPPTSAELAEANGVSHAVAKVAAQASPSVVRISVTQAAERQRQSSRDENPQDNPFKGTPFERFFNEHPQGPAPRQHGLGSGVVIDARGYILTNAHVVAHSEEVKVTFVDGRTTPGKVVGVDPRSDLAVVKVEGVGVPVAHFGDETKMQVGETVIAIGNPFGLDHTVTVGVLSAKNRAGFESGQYEDFLQTDASINPGNSGGPLINLAGEVVGVNTMIAGLGTGIGFAVPSSMARPVAQQLIEHGKVRRPFVGILMQEMTPELGKSIGGGAPAKGALVSQVQPGSPAERAGIKPGDVVQAVDGVATTSPRDVQRVVLGKRIGDQLDFALWRDGKNIHVTMTAGELPPSAEEAADNNEGGAAKSNLGMQLRSLSPEVAERLGMKGDLKGAVVTGVDEGGPASEAGVRSGDVVVEVDRKPVASAVDARRALEVKRTGGHLLRIERGDGALFVVIPPGPTN